MKTYITFGQEHVHRLNGKTFNTHAIGVIEAPSEEAARQLAVSYFGLKWCTTYAEENWTLSQTEIDMFFTEGFKRIN